MEEFKESVSSVLRSIRAEKHMTQQEVAEKSGMDVMTISRYENNPNTIVLDKLDKILLVYGVDCYYFFNIVNAKKHDNKSDLD